MEDSKYFKLGWDSENEIVVHIDEVEEGFKGAVCPDCNSPLIAANRNPKTRKKVTYFRHANNATCSSRGETLVHRWGKEAIENRLSVLGASYIAEEIVKDCLDEDHLSAPVKDPDMLTLKDCAQEQPLFLNGEKRIPDLTTVIESGNDLYIEIYVSSKVNDERKSFYQRNQLNCLEIDISHYTPEQLFNRNVFEHYVTVEAPRQWISCQLYGELHDKARQQAEAMAIEATGDIVEHRQKIEELVSKTKAYLDPANREKAKRKLEASLYEPNTLSGSTKAQLESRYGEIPNVLNIQIEGELGFDCHRIVWQWGIYETVIIEGYKKAKHTDGLGKDHKSTGYSLIPIRHQAWFPHALKWNARDLYRQLRKSGIPIRPMCQIAEALVDDTIDCNKSKPHKLRFLSAEAWQALPKGPCVVHQYLNELVDRGLIERSESVFVIPAGEEQPNLPDSLY